MRETGSAINGDSGSITISGTRDEIDQVRAMLTGASRLVMTDEGPQSIPVYLPVPDAVEDPMIPPKWAIKMPPVGKATLADLARAEGAVKPPMKVREDLQPNEGWHMPAFIVKHLVAYNSAVTTYKAEARKLYFWGFECLRSRRGADGKFWELWYLPGTFAAKGELADVVKKAEQQTKDEPARWLAVSRAVIDFLCKNCHFGCADVTVQRAAMVIE